MQSISDIERSDINSQHPSLDHESAQHSDSVHRLIGDVLCDSDRCRAHLSVAEGWNKHLRSHEQQLYDCIGSKWRCRIVRCGGERDMQSISDIECGNADS